MIFPKWMKDHKRWGICPMLGAGQCFSQSPADMRVAAQWQCMLPCHTRGSCLGGRDCLLPLLEQDPRVIIEILTPCMSWILTNRTGFLAFWSRTLEVLAAPTVNAVIAGWQADWRVFWDAARTEGGPFKVLRAEAMYQLLQKDFIIFITIVAVFVRNGHSSQGYRWNNTVAWEKLGPPSFSSGLQTKESVLSENLPQMSSNFSRILLSF